MLLFHTLLLELVCRCKSLTFLFCLENRKYKNARNYFGYPLVFYNNFEKDKLHYSSCDETIKYSINGF